MPSGRFSPSRRAFFLLAGPLLVAALAGCGSDRKKTYPVKGKFVWPDGSSARELAGCTVVFQCDQEQVSSQSIINAEGGFRLGYYKAADGTVAGKHKVVVMLPLDANERKMQIVHPRYESFSTTTLQAAVDPDKDNELVFTVEPGAWMKRQKR
jgi:hypothetical protein